jgi:hypothetical protein
VRERVTVGDPVAAASALPRRPIQNR